MLESANKKNTQTENTFAEILCCANFSSRPLGISAQARRARSRIAKDSSSEFGTIRHLPPSKLPLDSRTHSTKLATISNVHSRETLLHDPIEVGLTVPTTGLDSSEIHDWISLTSCVLPMRLVIAFSTVTTLDTLHLSRPPLSDLLMVSVRSKFTQGCSQGITNRTRLVLCATKLSIPAYDVGVATGTRSMLCTNHAMIRASIGSIATRTILLRGTGLLMGTARVRIATSTISVVGIEMRTSVSRLPVKNDAESITRGATRPGVSSML